MKSSTKKTSVSTQPKVSKREEYEVIIPGISLRQYTYLVDWGREIFPQWHSVSKEKKCSCWMGDKCPSIERVRDWLKNGGERAPDYPLGYFPAVPLTCPTCGSDTSAEPLADSERRGKAWKCSAGMKHYWELVSVAMKTAIEKNDKENNHWLIAPCGDYAGVTIEAHLEKINKAKGWCWNEHVNTEGPA